MINLRHTPEALQHYQTWWTEHREAEEAAFTQYLEKKEKNKNSSAKWVRAGHREELMKVLIASCHGKCAYCERYMDLGGGPEEIEHFLPKWKHPALALELTNMLLCCRACNTAKGSHVNKEGKEILNPYEDHPIQQHLRMNPQTMMLEGLSELGTATIAKLQRALNCNKAILRFENEDGKIISREIKGALPHRLNLKRLIDKEYAELKTCTDLSYVLRKLRGHLRSIEPHEPLTATLAGLWLQSAAFQAVVVSLQKHFPEDTHTLRALAEQKAQYILMPH
ncbi:hypothetical protein [Acanthopleuribacter pedis]|uniref:HNH nuclease domain-containing protein n=1 Tax=Acanthopleuribacter pedis TaxID=442870 RepID=A0A8J7QB24_9BACT|nr:hypothetical protein [Acanthopleuribacter pedis]MBO1322912.1 hypothetical protein [Acanthopleuribacter pedis]